MEFMLIVFLIIGCSFAATAAAAIINHNYPQSYQASNSVWYRSSGGASGRRQQRPPLRTLASSNHHKWQNDHHNNDHHHSMLLASQKLRSLTMKALYHHDNDVDDIVEGPTRRPLIAGITTTEGRYREWEIMQQNHHGKQAFAPPLLPLWAIEDYWALSAYRKLLVFAPFIVDRSKYGREAYVCLAKEWPYNCAAVPFKWSSSRGAFEIRSLHLYQATNKLLLPMEFEQRRSDTKALLFQLMLIDQDGGLLAESPPFHIIDFDGNKFPQLRLGDDFKGDDFHT